MMSANEDDLFENIREAGQLVAYQDWGSGGPGVGAGRVEVYRYQRQFYVFHDAGMEGPYSTKEVAIRDNGYQSRRVS